MHSNLYRFLESSDNIESLVAYDFKNEAPCIEIVKEKNSIEKFIKYKNYNKNGGKFDCDNSNGTCSLTGDIYKNLWGWEYNNRHSMPQCLLHSFGHVWGRMGADTINSFQTTYKIALKIYNNDASKLKKNRLLYEFASLTHTLGNFTLVPFHLNKGDNMSFNQFRGTSLGDYFDLSLKLIKDTVDETVFKKFIDTFLLNDYVDKNYNIIPLFKGHQQLLKENFDKSKNMFPQTEEELNEYLENVIERIKTRGRKMISIIKGENKYMDNLSEIEIKKNKKSSNKVVKILVITASILFVSFIGIFLALFLKACGDVGGFHELAKQHGFIKIITTGILEFGGNSATLAIFITVVVWLLYFGVCKLSNYISFNYLGKCNSCGKMFAMRKRDTKLTKKEDISILVELKEKDAGGNVTGTKEEYIPGERRFYKTTYVCKYCHYKSAKTKTKDIKKV